MIDEWQTIETAPKDGTYFLGRYELTFDEEDEDGNVVARGTKRIFQSVAQYVFGGIVEFPWCGSFVENMRWTHWMPLPAPPVPPAGEPQ